jgi:peptidoglycan/xylan/chitin deacetylase (PgdA/CDA1 family)
MGNIKQVARDFLNRPLFQRNYILPLACGTRFIFVFHDISTDQEPHYHPNYSIPPEVFRDQIAAIRDLFDLVSLDVLCDPDETTSSHRAALVFDDGFLSVSTVAAPYLSARGIPFAVFVNRQALEEDRLWCSDVVLGRLDLTYLRSLYDRYVDSPGGISYEEFVRAPLDYLVPAPRLRDDYGPLEYRGSRPASRTYMNATELLNLQRGGAIVGSHTVSHRLMARLTDVEARREIEDNRTYLESLLQAEIRHFAFPFGYAGTFDSRVAGLAHAQHPHLYTTNRVFFRPPELKLDEVLLPRIGLTNERRGEILAAVNVAFFSNRRARLAV